MALFSSKIRRNGRALSGRNSWLILVGFLIVLLNGCRTKSFGTTYSASANGNWENASTWSIGRAPSNNDTVTIPSGKTVTVTTVTAEYSSMEIIVNGILHFNGGKKIRMCDGTVVVSSSGLLEADNAGSKVDICSNMAWDGGQSGAGPLTLVNPLPVELTDMQTESEEDKVTITWETAAESNCSYYSVERSRDGALFENLSDIKGAGTSSAAHYYSYTDMHPYNDLSYYRLKQTDNDGRSKILKITSIKRIGDIFSIYPNPFSLNAGDKLEFNFPSASGTITIDVIDEGGMKIFSKTIFQSEKVIVAELLSKKLSSPGIYSLKATGQDAVYYRKIMVLN